MPPIKMPNLRKMVIGLEGQQMGPGLKDFIIENMSKAIAQDIDNAFPEDKPGFEIGEPEADFETGSITVPIAIKHPIKGFEITLGGIPKDMPPSERAICLHGTLEELRKRLGEKS